MRRNVFFLADITKTVWIYKSLGPTGLIREGAFCSHQGQFLQKYMTPSVPQSVPGGNTGTYQQPPHVSLPSSAAPQQYWGTLFSLKVHCWEGAEIGNSIPTSPLPSGRTVSNNRLTILSSPEPYFNLVRCADTELFRRHSTWWCTTQSHMHCITSFPNQFTRVLQLQKERRIKSIKTFLTHSSWSREKKIRDHISKEELWIPTPYLPSALRSYRIVSIPCIWWALTLLLFSWEIPT